MAKNCLKIYFDASPLGENKITGIPHFTAELIAALEKHPDHGRNFQIVLVIAWDKRKKLNRFGFKKVKYSIIPLPQRLFNLIWKWSILPPMDLIVGRGVFIFPNYKNWKLFNSYSLTFIHDLGYIRFPEFVQPKNLEFLNNNMERWIKRTDQVLTISENSRNEIIKYLAVDPGIVHCIYPGVETKEYYKRSTKEITEVKHRYKLPDDYILYLGSIEPRKNISKLLEAYCSLPTHDRNSYPLVLVGGGGWLNEDIFAEISKAQYEGNKILKTDKYVVDEDLPAVISGASVLTFVVNYEGFGLPPLQAMACGTPVLVSKNSSLPEVVGDAGMYANEKDERDISTQLHKLLSDNTLRAEFIARGYKQSQKFNWQKSADAVLGIIADRIAYAQNEKGIL